MAEKTRRIGILADDAEYLIKLFNIEAKSRPTFKVLFHRTAVIIKAFIERYGTDVIEEHTTKWAIEEANYEHSKGEQP